MLRKMTLIIHSLYTHYIDILGGFCIKILIVVHSMTLVLRNDKVLTV